MACAIVQMEIVEAFYARLNVCGGESATTESPPLNEPTG